MSHVVAWAFLFYSLFFILFSLLFKESSRKEGGSCTPGAEVESLITDCLKLKRILSTTLNTAKSKYLCMNPALYEKLFVTSFLLL